MVQRLPPVLMAWLLVIIAFTPLFQVAGEMPAQATGATLSAPAGSPDPNDPPHAPSSSSPIASKDPHPLPHPIVTSSSTSSSRGTVVVSGNWTYEDQSGVHHPIRYAYVELCDRDAGADDILKTTYTDANGSFNFSVTNSDGDEGGPLDLYTTVYTYSLIANVHDNPSSWMDYSNDSNPMYDVPNGTLDMGETYVPKNAAPPYHIMDVMTDGRDWLKGRVGWERDMVFVFWPYHDWPESTGEFVYIPGDANKWEWSDATILHEYAHCIHWYARGGSYPPGATSDRHHIYSETNVGFALTEGWASFFPCAVLNTTQCWNEYLAGNIEDGRAADYLDFGEWDGNIVEGAVSAMFWDMFDGISDTDYPTWASPYGDRTDGRFDMLWHVFSTTSPYSMDAFWDGWVQLYGANTDIWAVFYHCRVDKDAVPPQSGTGFLSNPQPGNWTNDTTIDVIVQGATDDLSGIWGYTYLWSRDAPSEPINGTWTQNATIPTTALGNGLWYLCIVSTDRSGKVAHDALCSQRPWKVDASAPDVTAVHQLAGSTQSWVWQSSAGDPVFTWSAPDDGCSGVAGYQIYWGTEANGTAFTYQTDVRFDPAPIAEGTHYLRMRVMDNVGNLGNWTTPYVLRYDCTPPANPMAIIQSNGITANGTWQSNVSKPVFAWDGQYDASSGVDGFYVYFGTFAEGTSPLYQTTASFSPLPVTDGIHYLRVRTRDTADNRAEWVTLYMFMYDNTDPPAPQVDDGIDEYATSMGINITWDMFQDMSGIAGFYYWVDEGTETWTENSSASLMLTMEGAHTIRVRALDVAGNLGPEGMHNVTLDMTPPLGAVLVQDNARYTETTLVNLLLSGSDALSGVAEMGFSEDAVVWSPWEPYSGTRSLYLSTGDGPHDIFVRFRDRAGLVSGPAVVSIILDTEAPVGSVTINGGDGTTRSSTVTLALKAMDVNGIVKMRFSTDGIGWGQWEDYATTKEFALPPGTGHRAVHVQFKDGAGKVSAGASDDIVVEKKQGLVEGVASGGDSSPLLMVVAVLLAAIIAVVAMVLVVKRSRMERARRATRERRQRMRRERKRMAGKD